MARRMIENTIPVLPVADLDRSVAFYRELLGFALEWNAGDVCSVSRDGCSIMLQVRSRTGNGAVWIGLEDDSLIRAVEKSRVEVLQPPTNNPWAYEMKIMDPDGNIVWLGSEPKTQ
jgi:catechol 2,3-dioxygenase-like lactoylglutathione lyase family enzyme